MPGIAVRSVNELVAFMIVAGKAEEVWNSLDLDALQVVLSVTVKGAFRDGRADKYTAQFIQHMQGSVHWAFKNLGGIPSGGRRTLLRVGICEGSDATNFDLTEAVKEMIRRMESKHLLILGIVASLVAGGCQAFSICTEADIERMKTAVEQRRIDALQHEKDALNARLEKSHDDLWNEFQELLRTTYHAAHAVGRDPEKPIRGYVNKMRPDERITVNGSSEYTKKEALGRLQPVPEEVLYYVHADGNFRLLGVELMEGTSGIQIDQGESPRVSALLERLDPQTRESITTTVDESLEARQTKYMDLQVDVYFSRKGIHHAVVLGVGERRPGLRHFRFEEVPAGVPVSEARLQGE